jgi:hypothetical protein
VELGSGDATVTVEVSRHPGRTVALTCGPETAAPWQYRLEALRHP